MGFSTQAIVERELRQSIRFTYTNHRGEARLRHVVPRHIWFGSSPWHPGEERWFLKAYCYDKKDARDFELRSIVFAPPERTKCI